MAEDVSIIFRVPGADAVLRTVDAVRDRVASVAKTSTAGLSDTRLAAAQFSSSLNALSSLLRLTGRDNSALAAGLGSVSLVLLTATTASQALRGSMNALPLVLNAVRVGIAALLGPWGLLIAATTILTTALFVSIKHHRDAARATGEFRQSVDDAAKSADAAAFVYGQLNTQIQHVSRLSLGARDAIRGVSLELRGVLGPERIPIVDPQVEAAQAKEAAEAARKARAAALQLEMDDIVRFNELQRAQWEAAAQARTEAFVKASDAIIADQKRLADETRVLIDLSNQQAIQAIEDEERTRIEAAQRALQEEKRAREEAAAAQQQFSDGIKSSLVGILTGTSTFADLWTQIWAQAVAKIIEKIKLVELAVAAIKGVLGIFGIFLQRGGEFIATRPTPLIVGEAGAERVSVTPLAGGPVSGGTGTSFVFNAPVIWDDLTADQFVRRHLAPALRRERSRSL